MEYMDFKAAFCSALAKNSLAAPSEMQIEQFYTFTTYLLEVNKTTNLTAIRNESDVIDKHLIDSLLVAPHVPSGARVLDLGCGPGFPSVPLAIYRPDLQITALDSTAKKIAFVDTAAKKIGLCNLTAVSGRAEDRTLAKTLGQFQVVTSRAVARLNVLCELCLPYIAIGGKLLAMKGSKAEEELIEAKKGILTLGGEGAQLIAYCLRLADNSTETRGVISCVKNKPTPPTYPRAYASILKKPL